MEIQIWTKQISEYMRKYRMAENGEGVLAAVSGGADSVCLLLILKDLAEEFGIHLAAFHLNHGLRGEEADRDEQYVRELCKELQIPLKVVHEDVRTYAAEHGLSEEEAGRALRYRHLSESAQEMDCQRIATAHHRDDQAETVLLNLFRGSGLKGLGGIRPVRGNVIRPLLHVTRQEIENYLYKKKVVWCEDSTNQENVYERNKVRNELLPWVEAEINERAAAHIVKTAEFASMADDYFSSFAERLLGQYAECDLKTKDRSIAIPIEILDSQPQILKTYLIRAMIAQISGSQKDISSRHIDAICALKGPGGGTEAVLPYGLRAIRGYEKLEILKAYKAAQNHGGDAEPLKTMGYSAEMRIMPWKKDMEIPKNQYTKWFDYDKIKNTLSIRTREPGDYFTISGGKRKQLKRFFIDEKIPETERGTIPLLADRDHILWIIGYRISEEYKVTDMTRTILEIRIYKGEDNDRENQCIN